MESYTNSHLVSYTKISPNRTANRNHKIDRVTIHCVAGQLSIESLGQEFSRKSKNASSNYGVDYNGRIGLYVEEKDRSWCSSSGANDHRAITIEVASDKKEPYNVSNAAYQATIQLVADICKRNNKTKITWLADKDKTINYKPASDEMVMTVHRWFARKSCPGNFLYSHMKDIAAKVNRILSIDAIEHSSATSSAAQTSIVTQPSVAQPTSSQTSAVSKPTAQTAIQKINATKAAQEKDLSLKDTYTVTATSLHIRNGAGIAYKSLGMLPRGTKAICYGYYTVSNKAKWLYVEARVKNTIYTGFCHSNYLKRG